MNHLSTAILGLALLAGCQAQDISTYWDTRSIDYSDIQAAEAQFAEFAELAVSSPEKDALKAMDKLFDLLKKDTVAYYVYSGWMDGAFYNLLSPCRSEALYTKAVERMEGDGILDGYECEPFLKRKEWIQFNQEGTKANVPGWSFSGKRTLVLVLDLGCPTCREALDKLGSNPDWNAATKLAVGLGYGPKPDIPGWEYLFPEDGDAVFDIHMTPIYFVVAPDGTVESDYKLAL